jgi:excinuclease ABC subunit A
MYAASHQAKMLGIQAKDFIIGQAKQTKYVCPDCKGAGVRIVRDTYSYLPALSPCLHCWGIRFRSPIKEISFKGKTLGEILNSTLKACASILQALPKMTAVPELVELLGLASIPMGMPVAALTPAEVRRLSILKLMLAATASTPSIIVLEEPFVDLSQSEADNLVAALKHPSTKGRVSWILVSSEKS